MKAQISRESHRPSKRYSGVYHIQGAMVTDADLDERSEITRARTDNLGNDAIRDGVPVAGGAVGGIEDGKPQLQEGVVYADGVRGVLAADNPDFVPAKPLDLFNHQADLPLGPALPANQVSVIYADIWERPVFPLEDPYLADAGLHGAITGYRTRTMCQIKAAPETAEDDIEKGKGAFPQIGSARLAITPLNAEILADDCDPCAEVVSAEQQVANALWRLEIVAVEGPADKPSRIAIAWSEENAAEIAPATVSAELFERAGKVYEFFSPITETRQGAYANPAHALLPAFVDDLSATPVPAKDHNGQDWPFVRRWDGFAIVDLNSGQVTMEMGSGFSIEMSGSKIKLQVTAFIAELDLLDAAAMRGDYWLVEMRRHAPEAERIRLVQETPVGILHHYCVLFTAKGDEIQALSDARERKLSFPALSDLPADHVGFDNNCVKLYGDAENVQDALDNLCSISADDIAFESNCPVLYDDAKTVQEALDALCNIDFSVQDSFRLLFDWGVVCGIVPKLVKQKTGLIAITAGAYLDRSGRLTKFAGGQFDLSELELGKQILFRDDQDFSIALRKGEACLALAAADGGKTELFIVPEAIAYGPDDPGFSENVRRCVDKKKIIDIKGIITKLSPAQKQVATKIFLASSGGGAFRGSARLSRAEFAEANTFQESLTASFDRLAEAEEVETLKARIQQARDENPIGNLTGSALEVRQMQQVTAVFAAFTETDEERLRRCMCEALFPTCPPNPGKPPYFVPIACLTGAYDKPQIFLTKVCAYCCRKQAMTWRSLQYFVGEMRGRVAEKLDEICCSKPKTDVPKPGLQYDPSWFQQMDFVKFADRYKVVNAFLDRPEKLPTDYVTKVAVGDLSQKDAVAALKGVGAEIADTVDINDAKAFERIEKGLAGIAPDDLLVSAGNIRPGDKVALLVQDGVARGYVLVEQGSGKLPFDISRSAAMKLTAADLELADKYTRQIAETKTGLADLEKERESLGQEVGSLKAELEALVQRRDNEEASLTKAGSQLTDLGKSRETLVTDIGALRSDIDALTRERAAAEDALKSAATQLEDLKKTQENLLGDLGKVATELRSVEATRDAMITSVREGLPVTAIIGNRDPELIAKLAGEKIFTVADLSKLTVAQMRRLDAAGILKAADAGKFRESAGVFVRTGNG